MNNIPKDNKEIDANTISSESFWDSLYAEILCSNLKLSRYDLKAFLERNIMFSIFFRNCSQKERLSNKAFLDIKDNSYIILIEFDFKEDSETELDSLTLHHYIKSILTDYNNSIGPLIDNRISILISTDTIPSKISTISESTCIAKRISTCMLEEYNITTLAGIGDLYTYNSIYKSFIDALTCLPHANRNEIIHILTLKNKNQKPLIDYNEAENRMLAAIRLGKRDAYDYFTILVNHIIDFNEDMKRNKILELLVLVSHTMRTEGLLRYQEDNYIKYINELTKLKGDDLIEWLYHEFLHITGYIKPQHSIDYSNKVVQSTKEYLEAHYMEDISLEDVAEQVNISPQYFSKLIKKNTGFNFIDWLSMLRVKKAKELLLNTNLTVKEICYSVGYKDPNYFSRIFKKRTGLTPSEFIRNSSHIKN